MTQVRILDCQAEVSVDHCLSQAEVQFYGPSYVQVDFPKFIE